MADPISEHLNLGEAKDAASRLFDALKFLFEKRVRLDMRGARNDLAKIRSRWHQCGVYLDWLEENIKG